MRLTVKKSPASSRLAGPAWYAPPALSHPSTLPPQLPNRWLRAAVHANRRLNMLPVYAISLALLVFQWVDRHCTP